MFAGRGLGGLVKFGVQGCAVEGGFQESMDNSQMLDACKSFALQPTPV